MDCFRESIICYTYCTLVSVIYIKFHYHVSVIPLTFDRTYDLQNFGKHHTCNMYKRIVIIQTKILIISTFFF